MNETSSYKEQFTPWMPNFSVDEANNAPLDFFCLLIYKNAIEDKFDIVEILDDKLNCAGVTNGYIAMFLCNAQRNFNKNRPSR